MRDIPTSPRPRLPALTLAALAGLAGPSTAAAQEPTETFAEEIEVRVVNLEVVVTDAGGRRVPGLAADAFAVRLDGEPVPITHFAEIAAGPPGAEPAGEGAGPAAPTAPAPGASFLVFIDDHTTLERNRNFVLEWLRQELGSALGPRDRMAIAAYDGREIEVLSGWSGSAEELDAAIGRAQERRADGIRWVAYARMTGFVANWIGNATRRSVLAAAASLRVLPAPPGRKALILVAGSWDPYELGRSDDFASWCVTGPCEGLYAFDALADTANELGYAIYAVDVEGRDVQGDWEREKRLQETLAAIADATGGQALLNTDRRRMLSITAEDSRSYYSIGVTTDVEIGSRHRVEVEVLRPGLEVRSRRTFVAASARRSGELETFGLLIAASSPGSDGLPAAFEEPDLSQRRRMRVPVSVFVPVGEIVWLEAGGGWTARLIVQLAWVDPRENSDVETWEVTLERDEPAVAGLFEHLEFELELPRRRHSVLVRILDRNGTADLFRRLELPAPRRR